MKQYQEIGQLTMQWRRHGKRPTRRLSASEVKAAIAAAARSDDSHRIVQQQPQRRARFAGGEGVVGQAGAMVGMEVISDAHPVFDRPMVRAVRKQLQTIALLSLAHFDYERAGVSQFVSQFVSHFRPRPFALIPTFLRA